MELDLAELNNLLQNISSSFLDNKLELIRAIQNRIAEKHLEAYCNENDPIIEKLGRMTIKQLDAMIDAFMSENLTVPRELYMMVESKRARESHFYLIKLLEDQ